MRNTIKPTGRSLGIIALLVLALVFSFVTLVSCQTGADGKDGKPAQKVYIDEDGYWHYIGGGRVTDDTGKEVRAYMRQPVGTDFTFNGVKGDDTYNIDNQLTQYYGNVKQIQLFPLPGMSGNVSGVPGGDIISYSFQNVADFPDDPDVEDYIDPDTLINLDGKDIYGTPTSGGTYLYYTSEGAYFTDNDGKDSNILRQDGKITAAKQKLIQLPLGTYRIFFSITRQNAYYYEATNVPMLDKDGTSLKLTVKESEVKASDFALVKEVSYSADYFYIGDVSGSSLSNILVSNREDLDQVVFSNVKFYDEGKDDVIATPVKAGRYDVRVTMPKLHTTGDGVDDRWYSLNEAGEKVNSVTGLLVGTFEITSRYPNVADYSFPNASTQVAYRVDTTVAPTLALKSDPLTINRNAGVLGEDRVSNGAREIILYHKDKDADSPAYSSVNPPVMPGTYLVDFIVKLTTSETDKNWKEITSAAPLSTILTLSKPDVPLSGLDAWLTARPPSTTDPDNSNLYYSVTLSSVGSDLGGASTENGSLGKIISGHTGRNVKLDLTGNTNLTSIGASAFDDVRTLYGITLNDEVTSIGGSAFNNCRKLSEVTLGSNVSTIAGFAFGSTIIEKIIFPDSLTEISANAFSDCSSLVWISIYNKDGAEASRVDVHSGAFPSDSFMIQYNLNSAGIYQRTASNGTAWERTGNR